MNTRKIFCQKRLDEEDAAIKEGGNPVTCCLTFIVSGASSMFDNNKVKKIISIDLNVPGKEFHVALNSDGVIESHDRRLNVKERSEKGLRLVSDPEKYAEENSNFVSPENIGDKNRLNEVTFCYRFHHGEQSLVSALEDDNVIKFICSKLFEHKDFPWGAKIYGVVLDICSPNYLCSNCTLAILSAQNPVESIFLKKLSEVLLKNSCKLPAVSNLKMITRVGSYKAFERKDPVTLEEHQQICIDMRLTNNAMILQRDIIQTTEKATQFHSTKPDVT